MITLEKLQWGNCFSYGMDNVIEFTNDPITQLVGANGHGKSSIPLILELVLFNKNSKGIKASDILNRYVSDKFYSIKLDFTKDGDYYTIYSKRASTQTVKLCKNEVDISAHTATNTFKLIEEVLGFDHKTFCQLVYQSSAQSLEFLTATDTARKVFLIKLLNLEKYSEAFEIFKTLTKEVQLEVSKAETAASVVDSWLTKHKDFKLDKLAIKEPVSAPTDLMQEKAKISASVNTIEATNKLIRTNQIHRAALNSEDLRKCPTENDFLDPAPLVIEKTEYDLAAKNASAFITKVNSLKSKCPTCSHPIDNSKQIELLDEHEVIKATSTSAAKILAEKISKIKSDNKIIRDNIDKEKRYNELVSLIDTELSEEIIYPKDLEAMVISLETKIKNQLKEISDIAKENEKALVHNTKIDLVSSQLKEMTVDLLVKKSALAALSSRLAVIQILNKAFSTNGLVAFKIESMIKDLEQLVNEYLGELSAGRFQVSFVIVGEKLNVVINDNGREVDMLALSSGEKARVNTATLLAIRKLMQQLSNTKINLLILDETIDNLDVEGKEKLVELLIREEHLNTFLISHGYSHPLLEKINIIKENNISRIET